MKLHAKDDDNEYLRDDNKGYWCGKKKKKKETKRVSSVRKTLDLQLLKTNFYSVFFLFSRQYWRYKGFPGVHP